MWLCLEFRLEIVRLLRLANAASVQEGMSIAVVGYPRASSFFERIEGDDLRASVHRGTLSAVRLGGEIIQFDATTDHGDSGGPVIDASTGLVVAIVRGSPLDPQYASRGLEQALPGSFYGPSSATIRSVIVAAATARNDHRGNLAVKSCRRNSDPARCGHSITNGHHCPNPNGNSAAYRVGFLNLVSADPPTEAIAQSVFGRLTTALQADNSLYIIPVSSPVARMPPPSNCSDSVKIVA